MDGEAELVGEGAEVGQGEFGDGEAAHHALAEAVGFETEGVIEGVGAFLNVAEAFEGDDDDVGRTFGDAQFAADLRDVQAATGAVEILEDGEGPFDRGSVGGHNLSFPHSERIVGAEQCMGANCSGWWTKCDVGLTVAVRVRRLWL